ncbi:cysteine proteinase [Xylariaceae sp. FL0594]|nr:cysteine proteinase [Xylariaceae sp. FL0594]
MAGFLNKWKPGLGSSSNPSAKDAVKKKEEPSAELTPLERMLQNAGAIRPDGSDKFFGMENFGNTCYCNSIVQALFYTTAFRDQVLNFPPLSPPDTLDGGRHKVNVQFRALNANGSAQADGDGKKSSNDKKPASSAPMPGQTIRPEDKPDTPEYKKKQAMLKGPILELAQESSSTYGMEECTFTGLRDIFMALVESNTRTGVLSPQRFLELFKRDNEMFRNSMHQDAHEFYGLVLNDVIATVESTAQRMLNREAERVANGQIDSLRSALGTVTKSTNGTNSPGTGWVHDIFEGVLTSETRCLTCETASQRDETFLDLSIDLEEHASVTSCLQKFSAEEMLCERNKFHCDHCGGLQEAEKRMKVKRLPKVLALHLKRFKVAEDYSRLQKLFHRVVYPYQLRLFNTTEDVTDPDRLYELYAVVIHIGGNAYHGHYVSVIKTEDRGWLLFDDEMVEPVDKHYVRNFFGDKPGMACAYVLFYQETTFEKVRAEQEAEGLEEVRIVNEKADVAQEDGQVNGRPNGLTRQTTMPARPVDHPEGLSNLDHAATAPEVNGPASAIPVPPTPEDIPPVPPLPRTNTGKSVREGKKESKKEAKALEKAQEKARKQAEKDEWNAKRKQREETIVRLREARKAEEEQLRQALEESKQMAKEEKEKREEEQDSVPALNRANRGSKSMSRKSFAFLRPKRDSIETSDGSQNGEAATPAQPHSKSQSQTSAPAPAPPPEKSEQHSKLRKSFSFGLGRKKSTKFGGQGQKDAT